MKRTDAIDAIIIDANNLIINDDEEYYINKTKEKKKALKKYLDRKIACIKKRRRILRFSYIRIDERAFELIKEHFKNDGYKWTYKRFNVSIEKTTNSECIQVIM